MKGNEKIFVSIAAYLDLDVRNSILDAIKKAKYADRLVFGICWQYEEKISVTAHYLDDLKGKCEIRIDKFNYTESQGPSWAKKRAAEIYTNEEFFLQTDAHVRFAQDWDSLLISELTELKTKCRNPLITFLPPTFTNDVLEYTDQIDVINFPEILAVTPEHLFEYQENNEKKTGFRNFPSPILEPGFIFGEGKWMREDFHHESIYYLGEEVYQSIKAYSKGYDFFLPKQIVSWRRSYYPSRIKHYTTHPTSNPKEKIKESLICLQDLLQQKANEISENDERSLADYEAFAKVRFNLGKLNINAV
ncbi:GlcNAc-transferase family protein [Jiulongibacter sediminis]|uniref:GlcNAc-transferase family protein n=1 Tax=Jiulongibacter sediminis TaxID=1605367 RepID=UPI0026F20362|nr:GlcNAc-transferase family protein [Jiulongibacter sediminis]